MYRLQSPDFSLFRRKSHSTRTGLRRPSRRELGEVNAATQKASGKKFENPADIQPRAARVSRRAPKVAFAMIKHPSSTTPTLVFALFAACSVVAYRASSPGYLLPAVLVALSAHLANKIHRALRPLSELELLPSDLPCTVAHVVAWLRARDQDEAPLEPGAESAVEWAVGEAKPTELCVVYLHGWGASPPELSPVPEQLAAALGANLLRYR